MAGKCLCCNLVWHQLRLVAPAAYLLPVPAADPPAPSSLPPTHPAQAIADSAGGGADADAILLSPDFDDFDPSLVGGFDAGFAAAGGGEGGEDDAF